MNTQCIKCPYPLTESITPFSLLYLMLEMSDIALNGWPNDVASCHSTVNSFVWEYCRRRVTECLTLLVEDITLLVTSQVTCAHSRMYFHRSHSICQLLKWLSVATEYVRRTALCGATTGSSSTNSSCRNRVSERASEWTSDAGRIDSSVYRPTSWFRRRTVSSRITVYDYVVSHGMSRLMIYTAFHILTCLFVWLFVCLWVRVCYRWLLIEHTDGAASSPRSTSRADSRLGHSCLHKSAPCISVLRAMPGRVEANVTWLLIGLNSAGPGVCQDLLLPNLYEQ